VCICVHACLYMCMCMWSRRTAAVRDAELAEACEEGHLVIAASQPAGRLRFLVSAIPCARPESVLANDQSLSLHYMEKAFFFRARTLVSQPAQRHGTFIRYLCVEQAPAG
jgi:hypothetical protein